MASIRIFLLGCMLILSQVASAGFLVGNGKLPQAPLAVISK